MCPVSVCSQVKFFMFHTFTVVSREPEMSMSRSFSYCSVHRPSVRIGGGGRDGASQERRSVGLSPRAQPHTMKMTECTNQCGR